MDTENRFIDIETKLAFQEDTIQELNKIVYQQQLKKDKLQHSKQKIKDRDKTDDGVGSSNNDPADDIPPHY